MSFADCIRAAVEGGELRAAEADRLVREHKSEVEAAIRRGAPDPEGEAKAALAARLDDEARQMERRRALMKAKAASIAAHGQTYRDPRTGKHDIATAFEGLLENRNNLLVGSASVMGRRESLFGIAHSRLNELLYETRRKWATGQRRGQMRLENVAREGMGEATGDIEAAGFFTAFQKAADELVDAFNAAGGAMVKRERYLPQRHVAEKLHAAGKDQWIRDIKPLLDVGKMRDPLSGGALSAERLDEALGVIWERIVTDGAIDHAPSTQPRGRGSLATQRREERFLEFRDGQAWLDYHNAYGGGDIHAVLMGHLNGLARDVATLEVLGPNPDGMIAWMKGVIDQEKARHDIGQSALYQPRVTHKRDSEGSAFLDRMWNVVNGDLTRSNAAGDAIAGLRNWLTAANLGGTAMTAMAGDPFHQTWVRKFAGVPAFRYLTDLPRQLFGDAATRDVSRAGVIIADAMEHLRTDVGGYGLTARSAEMSRWLPDRVFTWTGLTPFTNAQRRAHAQAFMFQAGDLAGQTLAALDAKGGQEARFARWLKGFGIDEDGWGRIGAVRALDHGEAGGMLRPVDILDSAPGDRTMRDLALKYSEAMHALMEEATPGGTARARTALGMDARKGTPAGELTRSVTMYLSYPTTVIMSLINATSQEAAGGAARGASFLIGTLATLTLGGAMIVQMQALRQGRDLRGVFDDPAFWAEAATKGGGLGFYGDWVFADYKRDGVASTARLAGPVAGLIGDTFSVLNSKGFLSGEETNRSERAVQFARRNLPGLSMWPVKPFTDRLIFDRLQAAANPDAYDAWKRRERDLMREHGQGTWWRRGEASPHRAPDMSLW